MFEGKVIKFIDEDGTKFNGRVIACVKDIGITIVDNENPSRYLRCLIMKNAPNFSNVKGQITYTRKRFTKIRKGIISGTVDFTDCYVKALASSETCPFGQ